MYTLFTITETECVFKEDIEQYIAGGHTLHDSLLIDTSYTSEQEMVVEAFTLLRQQYMNEVHKQHGKRATANDFYEPVDPSNENTSIRY